METSPSGIFASNMFRALLPSVKRLNGNTSAASSTQGATRLCFHLWSVWMETKTVPTKNLLAADTLLPSVKRLNGNVKVTGACRKHRILCFHLWSVWMETVAERLHKFDGRIKLCFHLWSVWMETGGVPFYSTHVAIFASICEASEWKPRGPQPTC